MSNPGHSVGVGSVVCYPALFLSPEQQPKERYVHCPVTAESGTTEFINTSSRKGSVGSCDYFWVVWNRLYDLFFFFFALFLLPKIGTVKMAWIPWQSWVIVNMILLDPVWNVALINAGVSESLCRISCQSCNIYSKDIRIDCKSSEECDLICRHVKIIQSKWLKGPENVDQVALCGLPAFMLNFMLCCRGSTELFTLQAKTCISD